MGLNRYIAGTILFCMLCSSAVAAEKNPEVILATTLHYPPYEYREDGKPKGLAVDIVKEALHRVGVEQIEFRFFPWKRAVFVTEHGERDLLFNAGKNEPRKKWGYYVDSVLIQQSYVLFKRKTDQFGVKPDFSNVDDKDISIRAGYLYGSGAFRQALDSHRFHKVELANSTEQSVRQLLNERVDMFVGDLLPVMFYLQEKGLEDKIDIVLHQGERMEVLSWSTYLLFSKLRVSPEFVEQVRLAMEQMKADGTFDSIVSKYEY
ncbi:ABC transporter substrate-binding protein [Neptuniibacter sp.]|uniref:substrate-binding periplasmic protein n=1 Tax=Neptuniibacter sp. TaxID=1962643 RepID=UPI002625AA27|nr:transporter substrate-binding domain-containing protein [Neptuniibacter sp.]MCP4597582.1 amino acid ABC transporter substrate-binding protein [Neptuniibacter sp.]